MNYVGEIPDVSYYGADTMNSKEREESLITEAIYRLTVRMTSLCLSTLAEFSD